MNIELLTKFAGFLVERVTEANRPIIADFLEKFLAPEIQGLESVSSEDVVLTPDAHAGDKVTPRPRSGNGHKKEKVRDLLGGEKDAIRAWYNGRNGEIAWDSCVGFRKDSIENGDFDKVVAIAQVTGFVSYLHSEVASGKTRMKDMPSYLEFLKGRHEFWAKYNSARYREMRRKRGIVDEVFVDVVEVKTEKPVGLEEPRSLEEEARIAAETLAALTTPTFATGYKKERST